MEKEAHDQSAVSLELTNGHGEHEPNASDEAVPMKTLAALASGATSEEDGSDESFDANEICCAESGESDESEGDSSTCPFDCIRRNNAEVLRLTVSAKQSLLNQKDRLGRTPLHLALLTGKADMVQVLLSLANELSEECLSELLRRPFLGAGSESKDSFPPLHLALSVACFENLVPEALRCMDYILACRGADVCLGVVDSSGRTVLHMACALGCVDVIGKVLERGADPGVCDDAGCFPLHHAIDSRNRRCVEKMLGVSNPSIFTGKCHPLFRCIDRQAWEAAFLIYKCGWPIPESCINDIFDFAAKRGLSTEWNFVCEKGVDKSASLDEIQWPAEIFGVMSTALFTHSTCLAHGELPNDVDDPMLRLLLIDQTPENPNRLEVLCGTRGILRGDCFKQLRWIEHSPPAPLVDVLRVHDYWYVKKLMDHVDEVAAFGNCGKTLGMDSGDTKITSGSWDAALQACGCVLEAVERVCSGDYRNAFCAVRPPGHHLGPCGACDNDDLNDDPVGSQGFCLLNNVAVGAAFSRCVYRHIISKVAIVDFDVHHGNGTEAVIRRLGRSDRRPQTREVSFGGLSAKITMTEPPSCKPWLDPATDKDNIFFASVHGYGPGFYPGSGRTCNDDSPTIINVALPADATSANFRDAIRSNILPSLEAFNPDILFVSAGFDGHENDLLGNFRCVDEDYVWVTQQLMAVANRCCQGRLVSVLEGGYNDRAETLSPFAQAVANHVRTLMHTSVNFSLIEAEGQSPPKVDRHSFTAQEDDRNVLIKDVQDDHERNIGKGKDTAEPPPKVRRVTSTALEGRNEDGQSLSSLPTSDLVAPLDFSCEVRSSQHVFGCKDDDGCTHTAFAGLGGEHSSDEEETCNRSSSMKSVLRKNTCRM